MQGQKRIGQQARFNREAIHSYGSRSTTVLLPIIFVCIACITTGFAFTGSLGGVALSSQPGTPPTTGAHQQHATKAASSFDTTAATSPIPVATLFTSYYNSHGGATNLGQPVTAAYPTEQGMLQFFTAGALLLPPSRTAALHHSDTTLTPLIDQGARDPTSGIVRLALLQALLTVGSQLPIDGQTSSITFATLRSATALHPQGSPTTNSANTTGGTIFIQEGTRAGQTVGHSISRPFWSYIQRPDVSPDGWQVDIGIPLTEAVPFTTPNNAGSQHMQVQLFQYAAVLCEQQTPSDEDQLQFLPGGLDYLHTFNPPPASIQPQQAGWVQNDTTIFDAPRNGKVLGQVGQNFPLTLLGDATWEANILWYRVRWSIVPDVEPGWISASNVSFTAPGKSIGQASIASLSPALEQYLRTLGGNVGVQVYDVSHQRIYSYNAQESFIAASSIKIPIMLTFLAGTEQQGREPDTNEQSLLTSMIENSDNDSASTLYYNDIGGADGITSFMQKQGISGLSPSPDAWGYSTITPQAMITLLARLSAGAILTTQDRALALNLMEHVETDQRFGVGDTAPPSATVALKNGWVIGPDNLWDVNSSGIVTTDHETYIISVYTQDQSIQASAEAIIKHICQQVASLLR